MLESDGCKEALKALYAMALQRKLEHDIGTDEGGDYFEFIFHRIDHSSSAEVAEELDRCFELRRIVLWYGKDLRIRVYLTDCKLKEEEADVKGED